MRRMFPALFRTKPAATAAVVATVAVACGAALVLRSRTAGAQEVQHVLYISGMRLEGSKPVAIVRLTNVSERAGDVMSVHYTVQGPATGSAFSLPGAGSSGASLRPGRTLELDLGEIVTQYRRSLGLGAYTGPIEFVASSDGGIVRKFGPDTVTVDASQKRGTATFQALVEWR